MRPKVDIDAMVARYDEAIGKLTATGATVLMWTAYDAGWSAVFGKLRGTLAIYNELVREVADRHGAMVVDFWRFDEYEDQRMWDWDRLHMSTAGHQRMAVETLDALGVSHELEGPDLGPAPVLSKAERRRVNEHLGRDELFSRLRSADELHRVRARVGLLILLLRPEARVRELLEHAVLDPHLRGAPAAPGRRTRCSSSCGSLGIGEQRHALVDDLLADLRAAALLRERAASFVGRARVEREGEQLHEIADRLRLENHRVAARLDRDRIARQPRLLDRALRHAPSRRPATSPDDRRRPSPSRCRRSCER